MSATSDRDVPACPVSPAPGAPTGRRDEDAAAEFLEALRQRDAERLRACFAPDSLLRALVPPGYRERAGPPEIAAQFGAWFRDADRLELLDSAIRPTAGRLQLRYRFREHYADGDTDLIEQDAFLDLDEGRIRRIDLVCSGHRPEPRGPGPEVRTFDAGELGCGSGLPEEFRAQLRGIPVGSVLEVVARDASAREDLPSLARLLQHEVLGVETRADGATVLRVRRRQ